MAVLEEHLQVVGLWFILADLTVPPQYALAIHLGPPALGAAVVAKGGVGRLTCRTVVDAVGVRKFIHLITLVVKQALNGGQFGRMKGDGATATIFVLHFAIQIRRRDLEASRIADAKAALFRAFLGGDDHHAVAATRAIKGRCRGAFQDVDTLDVFLVDVVKGCTPVATTAPFSDAAFVGHGHTVDHDEGLVVSEDAVVTTDGDTRGTAIDAVGVDNLHTRRATAQGTDDAARA